jgi:hypothetical protein
MKLLSLPLAIVAAASLSGCATSHGIIVPPIAPPLPTESMKSCAELPPKPANGSIQTRDAWIAKVAPDYADCAKWQKELAGYILRNR